MNPLLCDYQYEGWVILYESATFCNVPSKEVSRNFVMGDDEDCH